MNVHAWFVWGWVSGVLFTASVVYITRFGRSRRTPPRPVPTRPLPPVFTHAGKVLFIDYEGISYTAELGSGGTLYWSDTYRQDGRGLIDTNVFERVKNAYLNERRQRMALAHVLKDGGPDAPK